MVQVVWIAVAGAAGAVSRYGVGLGAARFLGEDLPWGTLLVNVSGSLLLGALLQATLSTDWIPPSARAPLTTGFLGAFTTFSTFSVETVVLVDRGQAAAAAGNMLGNLGLGLAAAYGGMQLVKALTS